MSYKRCVAAIMLSSSLAFVSPLSVTAATISNSTVSVSVGDVKVTSSNTNISGDSIKFAQVLSSGYNRTVSARDVMRLRADFDFGFGDISLIYATAVYSGHSIDEISQLRQKNMGWGEIAKLYGVKVKDLKKGNYDVVKVARERGIDVTYIEIDNDENYEKSHVEDHRGNGPNGHQKDKHDNGKGNGRHK